MLKKKCLYVVAVPIGNFDDFTFRAIETLKNADIIVGEERSTTEKILKRLKIENKEIALLNEHNEESEARALLQQIIEKNYSVVLISEAGTPCIADPGAFFVNLFHEYSLKVVPIPGVSSIMAALMVAGIAPSATFERDEKIKGGIVTKGNFKYIGFLSQNKETRQKELKQLNFEKIPIILLETPYRMKPFLKDIFFICGAEKKIVFAYKLTHPEEMIIKSTVSDILKQTENLKKGEFVVILLPSASRIS